jgi:FdhD protein
MSYHKISDLVIFWIVSTNAADIISGLMWLDNLNHKDFIFYTTGRVTSEIVMKIAQMGISIILSRSVLE